MLDAINKITGIDAVLSTSGGTSDAAFIKDICPVIEFGMINKTAHQVNECVSIDDIHKLTAIYKEFIKNYFYPTNKILNQINVIGNTPDGPLLARCSCIEENLLDTFYQPLIIILRVFFTQNLSLICASSITKTQ